jgi:large subunit ribosomal protein L9
MKVFMRKDVPQVGATGEIIVVGDGYGRNFLLPKGLAVEVTPENEASFAKRTKTIENRKEVVATQTSLLAEKLKSLKLVIKKKMHDDGKLYGAINAHDVIDVLQAKGFSVSKSQIQFDKSIKAKGTYSVTVKLTTRLKPQVMIEVVAE